MTSPRSTIPGHEFDRDRTPYDDPMMLTPWRYRWNCSCGSQGRWQTTSASLAYRGWRKHLKNLRQRGMAS